MPQKSLDKRRARNDKKVAWRSYRDAYANSPCTRSSHAGIDTLGLCTDRTTEKWQNGLLSIELVITTMFYIADLNKNFNVNIKNEISEKERDEIFGIFSFTGVHHQISEIKNIVLENGEDFKVWMSKTDFQKCHKAGMSVENLILKSNKLVFNYASSIKTYIDIETTLLSKYPQKREHFQSLLKTFIISIWNFAFGLIFGII